ncbi:hypothetical protein WD019_02240 [Fictibacillus sp. Mic-4]|uniref:hypothetical protein n=1 Tax=Fictibacillus sp. Mic-4 TaxID=3132826 RepID=UPI003CF8DF33
MKLESVAKIHLAFENCEGIDIPAEDVHFMYASEITESVRFHNILRKQSDRLSRFKHADFFRLIITNKPEYKRVFDYRDIAQVHLFDEAGNNEWFFVYWGENEYDNEHQKTQVYRKGQIDITIAKEVSE